MDDVISHYKFTQHAIGCEELLFLSGWVKLHVDTVTLKLFHLCPLRAHYNLLIVCRAGPLQKEIHFTFVDALRFFDVNVDNEMLYKLKPIITRLLPWSSMMPTRS